MRLTTVNGQNRAAFVDNKRNMRKCNCHDSVTLIGRILSLVIILRITTKSQSSKNKSSARLHAPRLSEPMTAADRAVVALRTRRHDRSGGAGSSGVGYWTLDPKVQGSNPWGTGRWGLAASPSPWLWRWAVPPASGPQTYRKNSKPG